MELPSRRTKKRCMWAQSDAEAAIWKSFPVMADGTLGPGKVFFDSTKWIGKKKGLPDG